MRDIDVFVRGRGGVPVLEARAHVAYLPAHRTLSPARVISTVEDVASRPSTQTSLTDAIAAALCDLLQPRGVGVWLEARPAASVTSGVVLTRCVEGALALDGWQRWVEYMVY